MYYDDNLIGLGGRSKAYTYIYVLSVRTEEIDILVISMVNSE